MTDKENRGSCLYRTDYFRICFKNFCEKERPDALLPTLGGQTGLNMAMELSESGILDELNVELLGTKLSAIDQAEDRDLFKQLMEELEQPIPESEIVNTVEQAVAFAKRIGYPIIVRPAFTLGGTGGGMCDTEEELRQIAEKRSEIITSYTMFN